MSVHSGMAAAVAVASAMTVLVTMAACDKSPTAPGPSSGGGAGSGAIQRLELDIPSSIAPGTTVQLRVFAVYAGAQREEVTNRAAWQSTVADVLEVDSGGRATGRREGEAGVQASVSGRTSGRTVFVLAPDTWWVRGRVHDGGLAVANARVEVIGGIGSGKSATTDATGVFKLFGLAGEVGLRASAEGFRPTDVTQRILAHGTSLDFVLQPAGPPRTLAGEWTLTFQAAADCLSLPDAARRRTYRATIEQAGSSLAISLSGAQFALDSSRPPSLQNSFRGRVMGEALTLVLTETVDYYYYYSPSRRYDVAEQLASNSILTFVGTGTATATGSTFSSGSFSGAISVGPPFASAPTSCARPNHQFSLTR